MHVHFHWSKRFVKPVLTLEKHTLATVKRNSLPSSHPPLRVRCQRPACAATCMAIACVHACMHDLVVGHRPCPMWGGCVSQRLSKHKSTLRCSGCPTPFCLDVVFAKHRVRGSGLPPRPPTRLPAHLSLTIYMACSVQALPVVVLAHTLTSSHAPSLAFAHVSQTNDEQRSQLRLSRTVLQDEAFQRLRDGCRHYRTDWIGKLASPSTRCDSASKPRHPPTHTTHPPIHTRQNIHTAMFG